mgnify:CR=1 FL=1
MLLRESVASACQSDRKRWPRSQYSITGRLIDEQIGLTILERQNRAAMLPNPAGMPNLPRAIRKWKSKQATISLILVESVFIITSSTYLLLPITLSDGHFTQLQAYYSLQQLSDNACIDFHGRIPSNDGVIPSARSQVELNREN